MAYFAIHSDINSNCHRRKACPQEIGEMESRGEMDREPVLSWIRAQARNDKRKRTQVAMYRIRENSFTKEKGGGSKKVNNGFYSFVVNNFHLCWKLLKETKNNRREK